MEGADGLYDTYWIRFGRGRNSKLLFEAARESGVARIVHFSVANA